MSFHWTPIESVKEAYNYLALRWLQGHNFANYWNLQTPMTAKFLLYCSLQCSALVSDFSTSTNVSKSGRGTPLLVLCPAGPMLHRANTVQWQSIFLGPEVQYLIQSKYWLAPIRIKELRNHMNQRISTQVFVSFISEYFSTLVLWSCPLQPKNCDSMC